MLVGGGGSRGGPEEAAIACCGVANNGVSSFSGRKLTGWPSSIVSLRCSSLLYGVPSSSARDMDTFVRASRGPTYNSASAASFSFSGGGEGAAVPRCGRNADCPVVPPEVTASAGRSATQPSAVDTIAGRGQEANR